MLGAPFISFLHNHTNGDNSMKCLTLISATALFVFAPLSFADQIHVDMHKVSATGVGEEAGTVKAKDTDKGLELHVQLEGLTPGEHGFHLHQNPSCEPGLKDGVMAAAIGAGGHFDPAATQRHEGPMGNGHQGDLPVLVADAAGKVNLQVVAPRLKASDLIGHSFVVHAGPDNYADTPKPLGGGGGRFLCGVTQAKPDMDDGKASKK